MKRGEGSPEFEEPRHEPWVIPFGPLGLGGGIPSEVWEPIGDKPFNGERAARMLPKILEIFDDTDGMTLEEFDRYMEERFGFKYEPPEEDSL